MPGTRLVLGPRAARTRGPGTNENGAIRFDRITLLGPHRAAPLAHRPAIDMDKAGARVVADTAAAQAQRGVADLFGAAPLAAQIDRHPLDVIAVLGDTDTLQ